MKKALAFGKGETSVNMDNNIVLAEVLNSVTHGVGLLLTAVASTFMSTRASEAGSWAHSWSSQVYCGSLMMMYAASTLYHSFYFTLHTKELFHVFDQCAIYMLIAGTYTPVLAVSLYDKPFYAVWLLGLMWVICFSGITMTGQSIPCKIPWSSTRFPCTPHMIYAAIQQSMLRLKQNHL